MSTSGTDAIPGKTIVSSGSSPVLPRIDPATGKPWDVATVRHWADRLEAFTLVATWLGMLADLIETSRTSEPTGGRENGCPSE